MGEVAPESMGGVVSGGAAVGDAAGSTTYPVVLNVYDLTPINNYLHWCGLGIFHSAVEGERKVRNGNPFRSGLFVCGKYESAGRNVLLASETRCDFIGSHAFVS